MCVARQLIRKRHENAFLVNKQSSSQKIIVYLPLFSYPLTLRVIIARNHLHKNLLVYDMLSCKVLEFP